MSPFIWLAYFFLFNFFLPLKITYGMWIRRCTKGSKMTQTSKNAFNTKVRIGGVRYFLFQANWIIEFSCYCKGNNFVLCIYNPVLCINGTILFLWENICGFHYFCSYFFLRRKTWKWKSPFYNYILLVWHLKRQWNSTYHHLSFLVLKTPIFCWHMLIGPMAIPSVS